MAVLARLPLLLLLARPVSALLPPSAVLLRRSAGAAQAHVAGTAGARPARVRAAIISMNKKQVELQAMLERARLARAGVEVEPPPPPKPKAPVPPPKKKPPVTAEQLFSEFRKATGGGRGTSTVVGGSKARPSSRVGGATGRSTTEPAAPAEGAPRAGAAPASARAGAGTVTGASDCSFV
jgi:hypothetical protein